MAELMDMLRTRKADFVLAFRPTCPLPDIESHILFQNYLAAIVRENHPLAARKSLTLTELATCDLALPSQGLQAVPAFDGIRFRGRFPHKDRDERGQHLAEDNTTDIAGVCACRGHHPQREGSGGRAPRFPGQRDGRVCPHPSRDLSQAGHAGVHPPP